MMLTLAACDPGGRLSQLTPPAATPMVLGTTAEAQSGIGPIATARSEEQPGPALDQPIPLPSPTYDSSLPAWTILYYSGTDNGRASFVWDDLNEMESAGLTDQVRVVTQVDWSEGNPTGFVDTVRYLINPDNDGTRLASEPVVSLGEANMGDPATLTDFLTWGIATYPANRYALVLGDFGGGWQGCCFDDVTGADGQSDHLSLPDLDQALASAYSQTENRFEVIAFSAGLMSQLDVLQVIQPYGGYAVASAGLMPGSSWDFQAVVAQLNADPLIEGRQFSGDLVTAYVNYQRQLAGDEFVGMAAIDLFRIPTLTAAVETMAQSMLADPALYGAIGRDARRGAQRYGEAALTDAERLAAVDILHAAAIIAESAPAGELQTAATAVSTAVTESLVAYDHGQGIPYGRGIAIYWPETPEAIDPLYAQVTRLPSWASYLAGAGMETAQPPLVTVDSGPRQTVSIANPALMRSEVIGQNLTEIALIADQEAADGRRVLRQYEIVQPATVTMPGGTNASVWIDGRHESLIIWDATASYIQDSAGAGDFAALRPVNPSPIGTSTAVIGTFRPGGEKSVEATVVFGLNDTASFRLWAATTSNGSRLIGEIPTVAGNVFQPSVTFLTLEGTLTHEQGVALIYDSSGAIYRSSRPLPGGNYSVGVRVTSLGNSPIAQMQPLIIDPGGAATGFRAFVDAAHDVQFLYPADWLPPQSQEDVTFTSNISNTAQLQVRYYPNWTGSLAALHEEILGTFGEVSILLQEPTQIGVDPSVEGIRTAYGYDSAEQGARTGMFLVFLKDGTGYVVDMDAPRDSETTALAAVDTIAAKWQFLSERLGFGPEQWAILNVADFRMEYPASYTYQEFNNWHRFTGDSQTFVAVRIQPAGRTPAEAMAGLLQTASEGVAGFTAEEPQREFFGGYLWERNDFRYTDVTGANVAGLLLSRQDGNSEVAVWAEGPEPAGELLLSVFLPVAASIERIPPPPSG